MELFTLFLKCPTYQQARTILLASVAPYLSDLFPNLNNLNVREQNALVNLFLNGDSRLTLENKKFILDKIFVYVISTKRIK